MNIQEQEDYRKTILENASKETPKDIFDLVNGIGTWATWEALTACEYLVAEGFLAIHSEPRTHDKLYVKA